MNNSIYDIVCYGVLDRTVETDWENVKDKPSTFPPSRHNHVSSEVTDLINTIYPVGSIYMSVISTSPQILFGGTWERIQDRFLLAKGSTYNTLESTGGSSTVTLTENQMPSHTHTQNAHHHGNNTSGWKWVSVKGDNWAYTSQRQMSSVSGSYYYPYSSTNKAGIVESTETGDTTATNQNKGGGQAHNNMPPYLVVNVWKRTA